MNDKVTLTKKQVLTLLGHIPCFKESSDAEEFLASLTCVGSQLGYGEAAFDTVAKNEAGVLLPTNPEAYESREKFNGYSNVYWLKKAPMGVVDKVPPSTPLNKVFIYPDQVKKLESIKFVRAMTGLGLKEAKDLVELQRWIYIDLNTEIGMTMPVYSWSPNLRYAYV